MTTLEIKHQIVLRGSVYIVIETFGDSDPLEFEAEDYQKAVTLVDERRDMLKEMVADISVEAREAVDEAREIDNLKAGNA